MIKQFMKKLEYLCWVDFFVTRNEMRVLTSINLYSVVDLEIGQYYVYA